MDPESPDSSQSGVQSASAGKMFGALQYEQDIEQSYPRTPGGQIKKFFDFWRSPTSYQKTRLQWRALKSNITWSRRRLQKRIRDSRLGQLPIRYQEWRQRRIIAKRKRRAADHKLQQFLKDYRRFRKEELMREWRYQNYFEADFDFVLLVFDKVAEIVWPWLYLFIVPGQRYWLIPLLIPVVTMKGTIWGMLVDNCFLAWCAGMWLKSSPRILY